MILEIRAANCFAFEAPISFSMQADMRSKKFSSNVHRENNWNILKTAGIYGANNTGKTSLIRCIKEIKNILLNKSPGLIPNIFSSHTICSLGVTFSHSEKIFSYDFKYDSAECEFLYEKFVEITKDQYGNEKQDLWLLKDTEKAEYKCIDGEIGAIIPLIAKTNLLCYLINTNQFKHLREIKNMIAALAEKIDIINMNNIPIEHTITLMKNDHTIQKKIVDFIKNADIYLENFEYSEHPAFTIIKDQHDTKPEETALNISERLMDQIRLVSTYKGKKVPSIIFDSTGTKKIAAIASYVIECLEQGRILVVDELDSGLHFKLTRAIVVLFNNELNNSSQMIFTVHDINLMDCKKLFRKEQIWFIHKDDKGVYVYSLAEFTAQKGIRDSSDLIEKYRKGVFGALPDPDLIHSLLDLKGNKKDT